MDGWRGHLLRHRRSGSAATAPALSLFDERPGRDHQRRLPGERLIAAAPASPAARRPRELLAAPSGLGSSPPVAAALRPERSRCAPGVLTRDGASPRLGDSSWPATGSRRRGAPTGLSRPLRDPRPRTVALQARRARLRPRRRLDCAIWPGSDGSRHVLICCSLLPPWPCAGWAADFPTSPPPGTGHPPALSLREAGSADGRHSGRAPRLLATGPDRTTALRHAVVRLAGRRRAARSSRPSAD